MTGLPDDLTNKRFGKLTALCVAENKEGKRAWLCKCDCGNEVTVETFQLNAGNRTQCKDCRTTNLIGSRSGNLVVIKKLHKNTSREQYWLCQCDCGNTKEALGKNIQRKSTTHCGCLTAENIGKGHRLENNLAGWNKLFDGYKRNASSKNLEFTLNKEEFLLFCKDKCFYCGDEPKRQLKLHNSTNEIYFNGIDRKDNTLGYILNNCVTCCTLCNYMKREMNYEDFIIHMTKISNNLIKDDPLCRPSLENLND
jgi:hypothetical protein